MAMAMAAVHAHVVAHHRAEEMKVREMEEVAHKQHAKELFMLNASPSMREKVKEKEAHHEMLNVLLCVSVSKIQRVSILDELEKTPLSFVSKLIKGIYPYETK